jgi:predicted transcriptional regulator
MITEITQLNYITVCQVISRLKDQGSIAESKRMLSLTPEGSRIAETYLPAKEDLPTPPPDQRVDDVMPPGAV